MKIPSILRYAPLVLMCTAAFAADNASCDPQLISSLEQCQRLVGSLRYDKMGQARVFAPDGSVYTAGQVQWMRGQLQLIEAACAHGDASSAARRLAEVQELIKEHHYSAS